MSIDYANYAQPWAQKQEETTRIRRSSNSMWFYAHHPFSWEFCYVEFKGTGKGRPKKIGLFLPSLRKIDVIPGVNGCRDDGRGGADPSLMDADLITGGWTKIDPIKSDYLRVIPCMGGSGTYYSNKFTKIEDLAGRVIETFDHKAFDFWRAELVATGLIKLPHPHVLKRTVIEVSQKINRYAKYQHIPEKKEQIDSMYKTKKDMKSAIENIAAKGVESYVS